jgi:hypothetical protein
LLDFLAKIRSFLQEKALYQNTRIEIAGDLAQIDDETTVNVILHGTRTEREKPLNKLF